MRVLVTGIAGFVGRMLSHELITAGHEVVGIDLAVENCLSGISTVIATDLTNSDSVHSAIKKLQPEACVHLGGIASPPVGKRNPELMLNTNVLGTAFVLEALRQDAPNAKMLLASTSYVYGNGNSEEAISEDSALSPIGIYAVSKAAADMMTLAYAKDYGMQTMTARAANHTGPGQSTEFVVPAFASQIKAIATGTQPAVMRVGNLDSERTFLDVRDVVRAYRQLIESGTPGLAYNIASTERVSIKTILDTLCESAGVTPTIEIDPAFYRPTDRSPILSTQRIQNATGWQAIIPLQKTLHDIMERA